MTDPNDMHTSGGYCPTCAGIAAAECHASVIADLSDNALVAALRAVAEVIDSGAAS